jgi:hypothetical protein
VNTAKAYDVIVRFEGLGGEEDGGPETTDVIREMNEEVELRLVKPACGPQCNAGKEIIDSVLKTTLTSRQ